MSVIKNSVIYLSSSLISKGAPFLLLPFLTSYLDVDEFGLLAVFLVINSIYGALVGMAMHTNVIKNFFKKTREELSIIVCNIFVILSISTAAYLVLTLLAVYAVDAVFSVPSLYFLILPPLAFIVMINQVHLAVLRGEGRAYLFGVFEVSNAFISVAVTLLLLKYFDMGWLAQVIGMTCAGIILGLIAIRYLLTKHYLCFCPRKAEIFSILRLSMPLIPHVLGGVVISASDRLFIENMVGLESVALYAIGYSFGQLVALFTDAVIKAWSPWFYRQLAEPSDSGKLIIVKSTYLYIVGVFVVAYIVSVIGEFLLPYVVDPDYLGAKKYIWWISLGYAVHGIYKIFFPYLVHISKTAFLAFSTVIAALVNLLLNYYLIPPFGALGAAYATIIAFSASAILVFEYQRRKFPMPWIKK